MIIMLVDKPHGMHLVDSINQMVKVIFKEKNLI
jgi:hypothetical protein